MNNPITFCINTTKFELEYLKILIHSLQVNLDRKDHEIIVFVENDTDNDDVVTFLKSQKNVFSDLKIIKNNLPICIGYANNINIMFSKAKHDIVSYLQSDMCIAPGYDSGILSSLERLGKNTILSATRIEPSLHPPSPEKITFDFGLNPSEIQKNFNDFCTFANQQKSQFSSKITDFFFAPFTLYKELWLNIGGHDTFFRRSREDSDILYRMTMMGYNIKQCWNAFVYHRSCVSSRGLEWWTTAGSPRTNIQTKADAIEQSRYQYKWHNRVTHSPFPSPNDYRYNVSLNIKHADAALKSTSDIVFLFQWTFDKIYVGDNQLLNQVLKQEFNSKHDLANTLLNISSETWEKYKYLYRRCDYEERISPTPLLHDDVIVEIDMSKTLNMDELSLLSNIDAVIHEYKNAGIDLGSYEFGEGIVITFNAFNNRIRENLVVKNPPIDDINFTIL